MRIIVSMLGALCVVFLLMLTAVFLFNAFNSEETIEVTDLELKDVISNDDYSMLNILCECQSEEIELDAQETSYGYGCKRRILSATQKIELPTCEQQPESKGVY